MSAAAVIVVVAGAPGTCAAAACDALAADPDLRVAARATTRAGAAAAIAATAADVAVVDLGLVSLSEFFLAGWGRVSRATRFVVVGHDAHPRTARRLMTEGVAAYVPATEIPARLTGAVRAAAGLAPASAAPAPTATTAPSTNRLASPSGSVQLPMSADADGSPVVRLSTYPSAADAASPAAAASGSRERESRTAAPSASEPAISAMYIQNM
jgi:hypothetical protein